MEARMMGEAAAQTAGMKIDEVNEILKKFVAWYEPQYTSADLGKTFQECYDVKTVRPTKEYLEVYDNAKARMADWGFEISQYNTGVMYGGYEDPKNYRY
jgi:methylamine--corrinoid protein Co-methyltransferase